MYQIILTYSHTFDYWVSGRPGEGPEGTFHGKLGNVKSHICSAVDIDHIGCHPEFGSIGKYKYIRIGMNFLTKEDAIEHLALFIPIRGHDKPLFEKYHNLYNGDKNQITSTIHIPDDVTEKLENIVLSYSVPAGTGFVEYCIPRLPYSENELTGLQQALLGHIAKIAGANTFPLQ